MDLRAKEGASATDLAAAMDALAEADKKVAVAAKGAADAQKRQTDTDRAAGAAAKDGAVAADATAASSDKASKSADGHAAALGGLGKAAGLMAVGLTVAGGAMVKSAGDFQSSTQHLVTDAGESQKNLQMVQTGILDLAKSTGTSADELVAGMYHIESAGFHGADAVKMLGIAAQGARVGGADLDTMTKTLTGSLNSYSTYGYTATGVTNGLIKTVSLGDMKLQDLASSLGNVAPVAAAAGVDISQVEAATATMTAQNMSAQQATQDLANTIRNLQKPSEGAVKEMAALGLNSNDVSQNLGKRGLTGTMELLTKAVAAHTKGGQVLIKTYQDSKTAAADANEMLKSLPAHLQAAAKGYLDGSVSAKAWRQDLQGLSPINEHLMAQFATVADKTHSFNDLLAKGGPAAQTYNAAMSELLGGATGLNTSLMLTGGRMQTFKDNADAIKSASGGASDKVEDWDKIQGTMNQKMDVAKASIGATAIQIGTALMPAAQSLLGTVQAIITPIANWVQGHQQLTGQLIEGAVAVGGFVAAVSVVTKVGDTFKTTFSVVGGVFKIFRSDMVTTATSATVNAGKTSLAWLGATAKMAGQGIASAASWAVGMVGRAVTVTASAVANAATTSASWLASNAAIAVDALATGGAWLAGTIARFLMVSGAAVAQAAVTAGAWIAANSAMLLASGGIVLLLTGIVVAVVELAKHWSQVWHDIKQWAWDAWHWLDQNVVQPIEAGFLWVWHNVLEPYLAFWKTMWDDMKKVAAEIWHWIDDNVIKPMSDALGSVTGALKGVGNIASKAGGFVSNLFSFDDGGYVPGSPGQAMLAVVHGGEYVLSRDMLAGRTAPAIGGLARTGGGRQMSLAPSGGGYGGVTYQVIVSGNQVLGDSGVNQLAKKVGDKIVGQLASAGVRVRS